MTLRYTKMIPATWANIPKTTNSRLHQFGHDGSTAGNAHYVNIPGQRGPARPACCVSHGSTLQDTPPPPRSPALTGKVDARDGRVGREGLPQRCRPRVSDAVACHPECPHVSPRSQRGLSERLAAAAAQAPARARAPWPASWHDKTQATPALRAACLTCAKAAKTRPRPRAAPHLPERLMLVTAE